MYVSSVQLSQRVWEDALEYELSEHRSHTLELTEGANVPGRHIVHQAEPLTFEYDPAGHTVHTGAPTAPIVEEPTGHSEHTDVALPSDRAWYEEAEPAGHAA